MEVEEHFVSSQPIPFDQVENALSGGVVQPISDPQDSEFDFKDEISLSSNELVDRLVRDAENEENLCENMVYNVRNNEEIHRNQVDEPLFPIPELGDHNNNFEENNNI